MRTIHLPDSWYPALFGATGYLVSGNQVMPDIRVFGKFAVRHNLSFKQFNPTEPSKYGMLYKSIKACRYPLTYLAAVYSGTPKAEPTFYCTSGTTHIVKHLIQNIKFHINLVRRNILYDRLYTSIPMAQWLLDCGITFKGTLQSNRKEIPTEIKEIKDEETNSCEIYWEKDNGILICTICDKNQKLRKAKCFIIVNSATAIYYLLHYYCTIQLLKG